jgi:hypothetical protein
MRAKHTDQEGGWERNLDGKTKRFSLEIFWQEHGNIICIKISEADTSKVEWKMNW